MKNSVIVFLIFILFSCDSSTNSNDEYQWPNHPPVIEDIVEFPGTRGISYSFDLICVASDEDGDSLTYTWDSKGGNFIDFDGNAAFWVGDSLGSYSVSCLVSDGKATDELEITINVITPFLQ